MSVVLPGALRSWSAVGADLAQTHRVMHASLAMMFGLGWLLGSRQHPRRPVLAGIDAAGLLLTCFAIAGMIAHADTGHDGAMELVAAMLLVLAARAILIPSTGRQTLVLSLAATTLAIATFVWHAIYLRACRN